VSASLADGISQTPVNEKLATGVGIGMYGAAQALVAMNDQALAPAGGDQPHNNLMPYLTFYFNIALQGVFPPRG
jgi:microcystin-dependent protein